MSTQGIPVRTGPNKKSTQVDEPVFALEDGGEEVVVGHAITALGVPLDGVPCIPIGFKV